MYISIYVNMQLNLKIRAEWQWVYMSTQCRNVWISYSNGSQAWTLIVISAVLFIETEQKCTLNRKRPACVCSEHIRVIWCVLSVFVKHYHLCWWCSKHARGALFTPSARCHIKPLIQLSGSGNTGNRHSKCNQSQGMDNDTNIPYAVWSERSNRKGNTRADSEPTRVTQSQMPEAEHIKA